MSSSFTRDTAEPPATSAESASTTITTTTTTTTTAANAATNNHSRSPSGSSSNSPGGGNGRVSSDGNSPARRLPAVLRAPAGSSNVVPNIAVPTQADAAATRPQVQAQQSPNQQQGQSLSPSTGNRDITGMGRRHMYPIPALASPYNGSEGAVASPVQMPQYFGSVEGGRLTTGSSSYNHNHLSPVSSPAMAGEAWTQSVARPNMANRGLKRHLPQQYDAPMYDGYGGQAGSSVGGPVSSNTAMRTPQQSAIQNAANMVSSGPPSIATLRQGPSSINGTGTPTNSNSGGGNHIRSAQMYGMPPNEDPMQYEPSGEARHPRDTTRYETWTSKQLRKKCSHLKLRGLKNVKKHVMVEALYRYYRNQRLKDMAEATGAENSNVASQQQISTPQQQLQQRRMEARRPANVGGSSMSGSRPDMQYRPRYEQRGAGPSSQSQYGSHSSRSRSYNNYGNQSPSPPSSGGDSGGSNTQRPGTSKPNNSGYYLDEESKGKSQYKEVPVTSEDVIRLVDVVLSPEFVDRLAAELSRWQFWVDVREMYIALLNRQHPPGSASANGEGGPVGTGGSATNSRNFKWSSMQLWEIWKELSFAYTKTCFEFTAAGMNKRVDDREYINYCDGRPDVYYLHQRLHARPDLLHLIKSNEYIDEKCTSEASESIAHEQQQAQQKQQAGPLVGKGSPLLRGHKRYKRSSPLAAAAGSASAAYNSARAIAAFRDNNAGVDGAGAASRGNSGDNGSGQGSGDSRGHSPEENSTENSETTGEEGSSNTANSNVSNNSLDVSMRAALAEQKYFGLLLQNFEVIFESLHNKKVLLATLRKDSKAPDHLIADLHDDIHVLSALKKDFRNKLRRTMQ